MVDRNHGNDRMPDKKICVLTGTRADYGLLRPLIARIDNASGVKLNLLVTGTHLSGDFGYTCREIEEDGYAIDAKIEILLSSDTPAAMAKSTGLGIISFADYFSKNQPDILIALGDRFETFAAASAAALMRIPIAHINGGDTTEGAVDEFLRHSITKMSMLHFPSNAVSARRVIQLGEGPERVFHVGALHVECIKNAQLLARDEICAALGIGPDRPYALVTYHPATLGSHSNAYPTTVLTDTGGSNLDIPAISELKILLHALEQFSDMDFIITSSNADCGGRAINAYLDEYCARHEHWRLFSSLGSRRYLSAMRYARAVIGNSSSGLYDAPVLGVPSVNIGDRQKGRLCPDSVINCPPVFDDIVLSINKAISDNFTRFAKEAGNPYGEGNTSFLILNRIIDYLGTEQTTRMKSFHDAQL